MHALAPRGVDGPARACTRGARTRGRHARPPTPANSSERAGPRLEPLVCLLAQLVGLLGRGSLLEVFTA